ncbi:MAG: hypothetical protein KF815_07770 [Rhodospirillales bacterium]|nr:hypothetical protein [Rhodospirillales bacterium]
MIVPPPPQPGTVPASLSDKLSNIVEEKVSIIRLDLKREPHWLVTCGHGARMAVGA